MNVKEAIETRRAYRSLDMVEINTEILYELGRAAQLAPSCFNKQPWHFIFISDPDKLKEFHSALPDGNSWAYDASLIIAVISEVSLDCHMKDGREYYLFDTGIASGFVMLRATELCLVAHPMAGYDQHKAKELLNVPPELTLITIIAVGKHAENYKNILPQEKIPTEENRPPRKELADFIYLNTYGNSYRDTP